MSMNQLSQLLSPHFSKTDTSAVPLIKAFKMIDFDGVTEAIAIINCTLDLSNPEKIVVM